MDPLVEAAPMALEEGRDWTKAGVATRSGGEEGATGATTTAKFPPLTAYEENGNRVEFRRVSVPQHRMTPLKNNWLALYEPVTKNLKLDMRMNLKSRKVRRCRSVVIFFIMHNK